MRTKNCLFISIGLVMSLSVNSQMVSIPDSMKIINPYPGGGSIIGVNNGFQKNGTTLYYTEGKVGIGTSNPSGILTVEGGDVIFRSLPANKDVQGITSLALQNYGITGHMHGWNLSTASYAGGWGIASNAFEIWEYPNRANTTVGDASHRRFVIETGRELFCKPVVIGPKGVQNNSLPSGRELFCKPVVIGPKGSLNIGYERSFHATDINDLSVNGNVGIGTLNTQGFKLAVNGTIRAKEIKVESGWADFVFKKDYQLPTLKDVEKHINENGHLPNIPTEAEVKANGVNLGEMNTLLLQKIEELTLYIIKQEKTIESMKSEIKELKSSLFY